jgi:uncharacterized protein YqjF (DUF2071 family)
MLTVSIQEDCFFLASVPAEKAKELCPTPLLPVTTGTSGWISLAAARFRNVRLFGCPVSPVAVCAALMLLIEYTDDSGLTTRGNFFLKGFTTSRSLRWATGLLGLGLFEYLPVRLHGDDVAIDVEIPELFSSRLALHKLISSEKQRQMENLFDENRHAFVQRNGKLWWLDIEKTHWEMRGREAQLHNTRLFDDLGAEFQFAFDTSNATGRWFFPRRLQSTLPRTDGPSSIA